MSIVLVALGGFFGAISRFAVANIVRAKYSGDMPYGTLIVNVSGSFLLGYIWGSQADEQLLLLLGTGFMGAFTTFSTFKLENVQLLMKRKFAVMVVYTVATYIAGISFAFVGFFLGTM